MSNTWRMTRTGPGARGVADRIDRLAPILVAKAAHDIERGAKLRAPVDTGFLRNSIQAIQIAPLTWHVVVGAEYGLYVEWGTARRAATPYIRPAVTQVTPSYIAAMRQIVRAA
jgi:HK97 gp10 family phage protein